MACPQYHVTPFYFGLAMGAGQGLGGSGARSSKGSAFASGVEAACLARKSTVGLDSLESELRIPCTLQFSLPMRRASLRPKPKPRLV